MFFFFSLLDFVLDEDEDADASSQIPLDDDLPPDYGAIEVIQCLIEHHNAVFTDANETIWRWSSLDIARFVRVSHVKPSPKN